jgi:hypothetical protein
MGFFGDKLADTEPRYRFVALSCLHGLVLAKRRDCFQPSDHNGIWAARLEGVKRKGILPGYVLKVVERVAARRIDIVGGETDADAGADGLRW